jgi:hypothetical protein
MGSAGANGERFGLDIISIKLILGMRILSSYREDAKPHGFGPVSAFK